MIPKFPIFKKIELSDKDEVENITNKYPPYSDFNFISMWSWDTQESMRLSILNDNLVVRFTDYITSKPFYSFLGDNEVDDTIEKLLELSVKEGLAPELRLIPEVVVKNVRNKRYHITENCDSFDYVYSTEKISKFLGAEHSNSRRLIKNFSHRNLDINTKYLDLGNINDKNDILELDKFWKKNKEIEFDCKNEEKALMRLINNASKLLLINIGIYVGGKLVSFTINEKLTNKYTLSHFAKSNIDYNGSYLYSMKITCTEFLKENFDYINCEQDLGLPGLKLSKKALCPISYLKKYVIKEM